MSKKTNQFLNTLTFQQEQNNNQANNFNEQRKHYNKQIREYFSNQNIPIEITPTLDTQIYIPVSGPINSKLKTAKQTNLSLVETYNRYIIKTDFNHFEQKPQLVLYYNNTVKILNKDILSFLKKYNSATPNLFDKVLYFANDNQLDLYYPNSKTGNFPHVTKYSNLYNSNAYSVNFSHIFPIINRKIANFLNIPKVEPNSDSNPYTTCFSQITNFYEKYLNTPNFRKIIPISKKGFDTVNAEQISFTKPQSDTLIFGNNKTDRSPQKGINNGTYKQTACNNIQLFFIAPNNYDKLSAKLWFHFRSKLIYYTNEPISLAHKSFNIGYNNLNNPVPEVEKALQNLSFDKATKYIAIYITPEKTSENKSEQFKNYLQIEQKLINRNIFSQCLEADLINQLIAKKHPITPLDPIPLLAIAINAKLGGIPWRTNSPIIDELTIGIGEFEHRKTKIKHIATATAFNNTGYFHSFDYFRSDQLKEITGLIENAIQEYTKKNEYPKRIVVHYYSETKENDFHKIHEQLSKISINIPLYVLSIKKNKSHNIVQFDSENKHLIPQSGSYINLGNSTFLLNNSAMYQNTNFSPINGFWFPIKINIQSLKVADISNIPTSIISELIDQFYQFSRLCWHSFKIQKLPATVKYPQLIAQIATLLPTYDIPANIPNNSLWFL